jgi:hypothetical protein
MALLKLNVDFDPMVIGADMRDSCLEKRVKGDPAGSEAARRLPNRPRKASAWSGNQQARLTEPNK